MKKFLAFFVFIFGFCNTLNALTSEQRFAAVKEKYPDAVIFDLNAKSDFVYVEGAQLKTQKPALETFFKDNPDTTLIIDFAVGDGFVGEAGTITLKKDPIRLPLKKIVISNVQGDITSIGDSFLSDDNYNFDSDEGLTHIDISSLTRVTRIGDFFLFWNTHLKTIDLLPLTRVTSIGDGFLSWCGGLGEIKGLDEAFMDRLDEASRKNVVMPLRESNFPALQALGQRFYMQYVYKPDPRIEAVQKLWNFEMLKGITPKALDDIPDMTKDHVLAAFDAAFAKSTGLPEATRLYYASHLKPILNFIFGETDTRVTWAMYPEQLAEMQIVLKHMAKMFNDRIAKSEAVDAYMAMMLDGFVHCQSRQAAELNRTAMLMGLMPMSTDKGALKPIYEMVNAFKLDKFEAMIGLEEGVHSYMRDFTAINGTIGLPTAVQTFKERMNPPSDEEITNILANYFNIFFTPENLRDYILEKVKEADRGKDLKTDKTALSRVLHNEMYKLGDEAFKEIYEEFYGDELAQKIGYAITADEIMRLLKLIGVLNEKKESPAGLFIGQ